MFTKAQVTEALKENFGFDTFKGNQEQIIMNLLEGKDSFVLMPTGGGKSLCYQLPSLMLDGTAIVISPLPKIEAPLIVLMFVPLTKVSCFVPNSLVNSESVT